MQPNCKAATVAETLLAVTLTATASVEAGDWDSAGQLLRRREQLLTQLEGCSDLATAIPLLEAVQRAEGELSDAMELATREAITDLNAAKDARLARQAYRSPQPSVSGLIERVG